MIPVDIAGHEIRFADISPANSEQTLLFRPLNFRKRRGILQTTRHGFIRGVHARGAETYPRAGEHRTRLSDLVSIVQMFSRVEWRN